MRAADLAFLRKCRDEIVRPGGRGGRLRGQGYLEHDGFIGSALMGQRANQMCYVLTDKGEQVLQESA